MGEERPSRSRRGRPPRGWDLAGQPLQSGQCASANAIGFGFPALAAEVRLSDVQHAALAADLAATRA
jgi:hypothetical protein